VCSVGGLEATKLGKFQSLEEGIPRGPCFRGQGGSLHSKDPVAGASLHHSFARHHSEVGPVGSVIPTADVWQSRQQSNHCHRVNQSENEKSLISRHKL
jgi:hypothetical protein